MDILNYLRRLKGTKKRIYLIFALTLTFLILSAIVLFLPTSMVDIRFSEGVQKHISPTLDFIMKAVSWFGKTWIAVTMTIVFALLFFVFGFKKEALFVLLTILISPVNASLKLLFNRPRPTADLVTIVQKAQNLSFPSGHVSYYVVFFGFLVFLMIRLQSIFKPARYFIIVLSLLLIFAVPFSRVYLGVHWFTDVTAGFILGLLFLYGLILGYQKNNKS